MARALKSLMLFAREAPATPRPDPDSLVKSAQLWLSVCLPNLALEALHAEGDAPTAVTEPGREQFQIVAVNRAAEAIGVEPGIKLSAALALSASLKVIERSLETERACLESLLAWAQRITPLVSLEAPEAFLLEVSGSLKLFHGLAAIKQLLAEELERRGLSRSLSAAPTPLASLWLARSRNDDVLQAEHLAGRVGSTPLWVTRWPADVQALLKDMGVRTIGDCLRLPRDGFARRIGRIYLEDLDKAVGKRFDPRTGFRAPQRFFSKFELSTESLDLPVFIEAVTAMLDVAVTQLRARQAQIQSLTVSFEHRRGPPTVEHIALVEPSGQKNRLMNLIVDRLERIVLPTPALALSLQTDFFRPMHLRPPGLFGASDEDATGILIERLRERFGTDGVHGVGLNAEHRPEYAWSKVIDALNEPSASPEISPWISDRPLWVLQSPLPLSSKEARSYYEGSVQISSSPERIESGWWDERDVQRDYYAAIGACGQHLWIFQDRTNGDWYLHGIFG
jgi:protein ImuB